MCGSLQLYVILTPGDTAPLDSTAPVLMHAVTVHTQIKIILKKEYVYNNPMRLCKEAMTPFCFVYKYIYVSIYK